MHHDVESKMTIFSSLRIHGTQILDMDTRPQSGSGQLSECPPICSGGQGGQGRHKDLPVPA